MTICTLPARVMNYRISSLSPTEELLTLGQILSEVGDYACTILDREHLSLARRCAVRLKKVVAELIARRSIESADELYEIPQDAPAAKTLAQMSIDELHCMYRRRPLVHCQQEFIGGESHTGIYESRIMAELLTRKAADKAEQLKIDYCVATYQNERVRTAGKSV